MGTVVACSTPFGSSGIAVVRLTGKESHKITSSLLKKPLNKKIHNSPVLCALADVDGSVFDEAVINFLFGPNTYTGENLVEINLHGNPVIVQKTVDLCCSFGAKVAPGGEFTKRAYINGKLDMSQAESVASLISSKSILGAKLSYKNLRGSLLENILSIKNKIISTIGQIEFNLDISEEDLQPNLISDAVAVVSGCITNLSSAMESFRSVNVLTSGASVVLAGPTNAGKSTLFNTLLQKDRAIVSSVAGTTRDVLENTINIGGVPFVLKDTAGIRKAKNSVEKIGVKKSSEEISSADLVLYLGPPGSVLSSENKNVLYVFNKKDIKSGGSNYDISVSALKNQNIDLLKKLILKTVSSDFSDFGFIITSQRQFSCLEKTEKHLCVARESLKKSGELELVVEDLNFALSFLDEITNKTTKDDVLDSVFSSFCVGK
jgi:tRNA modification GTPase